MKTKLNDLFDKLEPEKGNTIDDKIQVEMDKETEKIYQNYLTFLQLLRNKTIFQAYDSVLENQKSKNISKFTIILKEASENRQKSIPFLGRYLNKIIEKSQDEKHMLFLTERKNVISEVGKLLEEKEIHIYGNAGSGLGERMKSGKIITNGEISLFPGYEMEGGTIIIKGTCNQIIGFGIKGGEILVEHLNKSDYLLKQHYEILPNGYTRITPK